MWGDIRFFEYPLEAARRHFLQVARKIPSRTTFEGIDSEVRSVTLGKHTFEIECHFVRVTFRSVTAYHYALKEEHFNACQLLPLHELRCLVRDQNGRTRALLERALVKLIDERTTSSVISTPATQQVA